jgi:peptidoglycan/xylan/chitin deacetylase (PgdA/CDA1 family)
MFHKIATDRNDFAIHPDDFVKLLNKLPRKDILSIEEIFNSKFRERKKTHYILTFDDVSSTVYYNAFQFLVRNNLPFTLFVNISLLDEDGYISTNQLIEMASNPLCTIGSHGLNHIYYRKLNEADFLNELKISKEILENLLGKKIKCFAFPYGSLLSCSFKNIKLLKKSDLYQVAFSTIKSPINLLNKRFIFFLPRINVNYKYLNG